jgi:hypothetical protein
LRLKKWAEDGSVQFEAFMPDASTASTREDRGEETSIDWESKPSSSLRHRSIVSRYGAVLVALSLGCRDALLESVESLRDLLEPGHAPFMIIVRALPPR